MSFVKAMPMRMSSFFTAAPVAVAYSATNMARALITICQKTGVIDRVKFLKRTTAGDTAVMAARIETVSAADPTGTLAGINASGTVTLDATTGIKTITLTSSLSVTVGDIIAVVLYATDVTGTPSIAGTMASPISPEALSTGLPCLRTNATFTAGLSANWSSNTANALSCFGAVYSDGDPVYGSVLPNATTFTNTTIPTSGANSYFGLKFTADANCNLHGVRWAGRSDGSVKWECYDSSNTLLGTSNVLASGSTTTAASNTMTSIFATPVALIGGSSYRLVERSVSGASNAQSTILLEDSTMISFLYGTWCQTVSADGTTWTDDTTGICPGVVPLILPTIVSSGDYTYAQVKQLRYKMRQGART